MTFDEYCAQTGHYAENGDRAMWDAAQKAERQRWMAIAERHEALAAAMNGQREAATARSIREEGERG